MSDWQREQRASWRMEQRRERIAETVAGMAGVLAFAIGVGVLAGIAFAVAVWTARALT